MQKTALDWKKTSIVSQIVRRTMANTKIICHETEIAQPGILIMFRGAVTRPVNLAIKKPKEAE